PSCSCSTVWMWSASPGNSAGWRAGSARMSDPQDLGVERSWIHPPRANDRIVLVSGDDIYLRRYVVGLAASALLAGIRLHINAVAPRADTLAAQARMVQRFTLAVSHSAEDVQHLPDEEATFFAASRFLCA